MKISRYSFLVCFFALALTAKATAEGRDRWAGFYDQQTLAYWETQMRPGIEENFYQVILPHLTQEEKEVLSDVRLQFPLEAADHPMNFRAEVEGGRKTVVMPISSLRFFGDLALAMIWLQGHGYSTDSISDYIGMLKWQWPSGFAGNAHRPLEVLGIANTARSERQIMDRYYAAFKSAVFFILCHELGHISQWNSPGRSFGSQIDAEKDADEFALKMMRRIGAPPAGMSLYFLALGQLEFNGGDSEYLDLPAATHPTVAERLIAIATHMNNRFSDFAVTSGSVENLVKMIQGFVDLAKVLSDPKLQFYMRQKGLTAQLEMLGPRRPGKVLPEQYELFRFPRQTYSGLYMARWSDHKGESFDGVMLLIRNKDNLRGIFTIEHENMTAGTVVLKGKIKRNQLEFEWCWGPEHFGKGEFNSNSEGTSIEGTWGYTRDRSGAGKWILQRIK